MKNVSLLLCGVFFCAISSTNASAMDVGEKPNLNFVAADGTHVELAKLKGKMVLIDFWATWCKPCMAEADHMVKINSEWSSKGLIMVGISLDSDRQEMLDVAKQKGFNWPQYFDGLAWQNKIGVAWGVHAIPCTFLIGPDGDVLWTGSPGALDDVLKEEFQKHPPRMVDPKILTAANATMDTVEQDLTDQKELDALKLMAKLPSEAQAEPKFVTRTDAAKEKLHTYGQSQLDQLQQMIDKKDYAAATTRARELSAAFKGDPIGDKAHDLATKLANDPAAKSALADGEKQLHADEALAAAQKLKADGKNELAYVRFKSIVKTFPKTDAAATAAEVVKEYEQDPAFVKKANNDASADQAKAALVMAENYAHNNLIEQARKRYQQIIADFPDTAWADQAKKEMDQLGS